MTTRIQNPEVYLTLEEAAALSRALHRLMKALPVSPSNLLIPQTREGEENLFKEKVMGTYESLKVLREQGDPAGYDSAEIERFLNAHATIVGNVIGNVRIGVI